MRAISNWMEDFIEFILVNGWILNVLSKQLAKNCRNKNASTSLAYYDKYLNI